MTNSHPPYDFIQENEPLKHLAQLQSIIEKGNPEEYSKKAEEYKNRLIDFLGLGMQNYKEAVIKSLQEAGVNQQFDTIASRLNNALNGVELNSMADINKAMQEMASALADILHILSPLAVPIDRQAVEIGIKSKIIYNKIDFELTAEYIQDLSRLRQYKRKSTMSVSAVRKMPIVTHTVKESHLYEVIRDDGLGWGNAVSFSLMQVWDAYRAPEGVIDFFHLPDVVITKVPSVVLIYPSLLIRDIADILLWSSEGYTDEAEIKIHLPEGLEIPLDLAVAICPYDRVGGSKAQAFLKRVSQICNANMFPVGSEEYDQAGPYETVNLFQKYHINLLLGINKKGLPIPQITEDGLTFGYPFADYVLKE